jgi:hypothetical protein
MCVELSLCLRTRDRKTVLECQFATRLHDINRAVPGIFSLGIEQLPPQPNL